MMAWRFACFILLFFPFRVYSVTNVLDYSFLEKQLSQGVQNYVDFKQFGDTPIVCRAWGVWNFAFPVSKVSDVALDFVNYPKIFKNVYICEKIIGPKNRIKPLGTWFVEGRAAIARVWSIGNIDTLAWTDSSHLRMIATQNEDRLLESKYGHSEKGMINYRTFNVHLAAFVVASGRDSCRIGIIAQGLVKKPMPQWLVKMAIKIILPQLMGDLQKEVTKRMEAKMPPHPSWYSKVYKSLRSFLSTNLFGN